MRQTPRWAASNPVSTECLPYLCPLAASCCFGIIPARHRRLRPHSGVERPSRPVPAHRQTSRWRSSPSDHALCGVTAPEVDSGEEPMAGGETSTACEARRM